MNVSELSPSVAAQFLAVRARTRKLCAPLTVEDHIPQSMPEASPAKWHLGHTTWFFEKFVLQKHDPAYQVFDPGFGFLFNSYYDSVGERVARADRGLITRPTLAEVYEYREYVDAAMTKFLNRNRSALDQSIQIEVEIGLHHEMQHQELLVTDIKHLLAQNPMSGAYYQNSGLRRATEPGPLNWIAHSGGQHTIGMDPASGEFSFDNELPRHRVYIHPFRLASRTITNGEFLKFVESGGYRRSEYWLSLGWDIVNKEGWRAPLYWHKDAASGEWSEFTLWGRNALDRNAPVCHLSYFEADAYARWVGARLPTEAEWEVIAEKECIEGHFGGLDWLHPRGEVGAGQGGAQNLYGDVWEWTQSSYAAYPGYSPLEGSLGEYNGKFMSNQMVLRGGSCATPKGHLRPTYRNFFPPHARWQFSGLRLAQDG